MAKKNNKEKQELTSVEEQLPSQQTTYNQNSYNHILEMAKIPQPLLSDPESVRKAIEQYFLLCQKNDVKPILSGLGTILGLSRKDILDIVSGHKKCESVEVIVKAYQLIEAFDEMAMKDGKIPPIIAIFNAKNNYGYTDGVKVEVVKEELSNEEIAKRYREMHEIVSDIDENDK